MLRAFIATPLPSEVKRLLTWVQAELQAAATGHITWTDPEIMHLTLRFIGNIEERQVQPLADAVERVSRGVKGFKLTTNGIGAFPNLKNPKLIYLGLGDSCQLTALSDRISVAAHPVPEELKRPALNNKGYRPHLTLCRVRKEGRINGLEGFAQRFPGGEGITFYVNEIVLFKSDLTGKSPVYTALRRISLE